MKDYYVSVIIPNYCHAAYLDQRIQSVLNQTYRDFEMIILDDCSQDNGASRAIIEKYRNHPKVTHIVYNGKNSGSTFKQWEKGFQLAKGEYIWIAESDDFCDADLLEKLVQQVAANDNVSIAYCRSQYVDSFGNFLEPIFPQNSKIEIFDGYKFIKEHLAYGNAIWNASSAIFKRMNALSVDPQYTSYLSAGDQMFWIELSERGKVVYLHEPKNYFRQHQNKVTPAKQRSGVTSQEQYKIICYLERKKYLSFVESLYVRQSYMMDIEKMELDTEEIRKKLLKLWKKFNFFSIRRVKLFTLIYQKFYK